MTGPDPRLSRRTFLAATVAAALGACAADADLAASDDRDPARSTDGSEATAAPDPTPSPDPTPTPAPTPTAAPVDLAGDPFTLGVASGDPTATSVILWTRLAVDPYDVTAMGGEAYDVRWEVALDRDFRSVVAGGTSPAVPGLAHSVHVDATALDPDTWYWYRFNVGQWVSPTGSTRTLPAEAHAAPTLRFGVSSCQHWERGHYAAHSRAADEDLDLFVWLGDYIYETGPTSSPFATDGPPRIHASSAVVDLDGYRNRYGQYRSDPRLQRHHAARPWLVTWDDHEFENDYAGTALADEQLQRRAAAYQAWYEHMPVRLRPPDGTDYRIHRDLRWGTLAHIFLADTRQHRDPRPTDGEFVPLPGLEDESLPIRRLGPTALDPDHTMLGVDQQRWLTEGMITTPARWKVLAQQVLMHGLSVLPANDPVTFTDTWDGYAGHRRELLTDLSEGGVGDLVVLTGDFHSISVSDLRADPYDRTGAVIGTEFMAPPISSSFPEAGSDAAPLFEFFNPHVELFRLGHGYLVCELTPDRWRTHIRVLDDVLDPDSATSTAASFEVEAGRAGVRRL